MHAPPGATAYLFGPNLFVSKTVDSLGSQLFRNVRSGSRYGVWVVGGGMNEAQGPITVLTAQGIPPQSLYSGQQLETSNLGATSGYGYLTTRDGTQLSVHVVLPGPADQGPYPAVMEYSGYDPSSPSTGQPQYQAMLPPSGYAWVGVNIRGTGCSGGAFNFFENLQALDGYDAVETIAAQPWSNGHVGHGGHLLRGDQPALRRPHATAAPRRHHARVGHRRHLARHPLPGRHPQQRVRGQLRATSGSSRTSGRTRTRPVG